MIHVVWWETPKGTLFNWIKLVFMQITYRCSYILSADRHQKSLSYHQRRLQRFLSLNDFVTVRKISQKFLGLFGLKFSLFDVSTPVPNRNTHLTFSVRILVHSSKPQLLTVRRWVDHWTDCYLFWNYLVEIKCRMKSLNNPYSIYRTNRPIRIHYGVN